MECGGGGGGLMSVGLQSIMDLHSSPVGDGSAPCDCQPPFKKQKEKKTKKREQLDLDRGFMVTQEWGYG